MSRLSIELTPEQHQMIKVLASLEGVNIREYVLGKLFVIPSGKKKKPNAQVMQALQETIERKHHMKAYKTAKALFDQYR